MSDIKELVSKINSLNIRQKRIIEEIVDEIIVQEEAQPTRDARGSTVAPNTGIHTLPRQPSNRFITEQGVPLAIGDRVEILTTRRTGREGDIAEVQQFNRLYVAVRLLRNGANMQRAAKYLRFIE